MPKQTRFYKRKVPAAQLIPIARTLRSRALQMGLLGLLATGIAHAEETKQDSPEVTLPEVTVKDKAEQETATGPVQGYVAKSTATATKTDTPIIETPQSISVIGRDEMEARGAQDVLEAIRYTPGVVVSPYGVDNRGYEWLSLRGFDGLSNSNYRDGLAQGSFVSIVGLTEIYGVERIEVLRGPSSMIVGGGDAGGIINRISKRPTGDAVREVALQYGSFDRKQLGFDLGDRLNPDGTLAVRLVGVGRENNSNNVRYPDGSELENERYYLAPSLRWQPSAATSLTLLSEFLDNKAADDGYYSAGPNGEFTNLLEGEPSRSRIKQRQGSIGYQLAHQINGAWTLKQNFRQARTTNDKRHFWSEWDTDGRTLLRTAVFHDEELRQTLLDTQLHGQLQAGPTRHTVLFGLDWNDTEGSLKGLVGPAPSLDLFNPVYGAAIAEPTGLVSDYTQTTRQIGIYAQDQIKIDHRWIVTLGGRQDRAKTATDDRFNSTQSSQSDNVFSGRAGLTFMVTRGLASYASYTESFLPNSGVDADAKPLKPSRGEQVEVGLKYQPEGWRALFTAAVFDLRKSNVVTYDNRGDARQIGKQRSRGLELEAKAELLRGLNATASYTWLDMTVLASAAATEVGKTPIQVPQQTAAAWLDYAVGGGFGLGGGVRYVGEIWNDSTNTSSQPGFTLVDASLGYDRGPWQFALKASNLLNKEYVASRAYGEYYLGAERNVTLSAQYLW